MEEGQGEGSMLWRDIPYCRKAERENSGNLRLTWRTGYGHDCEIGKLQELNFVGSTRLARSSLIFVASKQAWLLNWTAGSMQNNLLPMRNEPNLSNNAAIRFYGFGITR